jgi:hypothetical protein
MAARTTAARKTAARKPALKVVEPEPVEEEVLEEELPEDDEAEEELEDEDEEVEEDEVVVPAKSRKASAQERAKSAVTFGVQHLSEVIEKETGKTVTTRELRQLIRKMARDESGRVQREIVAGNRARYDWPKGKNDPEVKAIIAAFKGGELEADKKEKLDALKESKAAQVAAKKAAAEKAAAAPAPKPGARKATAAATPAKKTTTRRAKPAPVVVEDDDEELDLEDE